MCDRFGESTACYRSGCTAAIVHNIKALIAGKSSTPAKVNLRGTLMKLGMHQSGVEICDRYELKASLGEGIHLVVHQRNNAWFVVRTKVLKKR